MLCCLFQIQLRFKDGRILSAVTRVLQVESPVFHDICLVLREPYILNLDDDEYNAWELLLKLLHDNLPLVLSLAHARLLLPLLDKYNFSQRLLEAQTLLLLLPDRFQQGNLDVKDLEDWAELLGRPSCLKQEAAVKICVDQLVAQLQHKATQHKAESAAFAMDDKEMEEKQRLFLCYYSLLHLSQW